MVGAELRNFDMESIQAEMIAGIEKVVVLISGTEGEPETESKSEKDEARAVSR